MVVRRYVRSLGWRSTWARSTTAAHALVPTDHKSDAARVAGRRSDLEASPVIDAATNPSSVPVNTALKEALDETRVNRTALTPPQP